MKQRFSSLDVKVMSHELSNRLISLRVNNIYDLSSRIFLIKFQKPDHREQLIVDSGFRCHLTSFVRTTATEPSAFVRRIRKLLCTRRVTAVRQIGTDRIIELQFSDGLYRMFLEFYAGGNIVVTDKQLKILELLRNVNDGMEHERIRPGVQYNLSLRQDYEGIPEMTLERVKGCLVAAQAQEKEKEKEAAAGDTRERNTSKKKTGPSLRKALTSSIREFPVVVLDHAFRTHDIDITVPPDHIAQNTELLERIYAALSEARRLVSELTALEVPKGFIFAKQRAPLQIDGRPDAEQTNSGETENLKYVDYQPFLPKQFAEDPTVTCIEIDGFNKAVDQFYSSIESQKLESKLQEHEITAKRKIEHARRQHEKRLGGLQQTQQLNIRKAEAIEANLERVQEAMSAVNGLIGQGMDWVDIGRLIDAQKKQGNPVANIIKLPLKLYENTVTMLLGEPEDDGEDSDAMESDMELEESDDDEEKPRERKKKNVKETKDKRLAIDIDLGLTVWANASQYYNQKKTAAVKEEKTMQASTKALKNAERKIAADLKKGLNQEKETLRPVRAQLWFEKFYFFISSDGYLVLGGRDIQQNEMIYSRYLKKGDVYVNADLDGATMCIIKNKPLLQDSPIPPSTLSQAGNLSVVTSTAWDTKAVMSAWWVNADKVSKIGSTGDFLPPGSFNITGDKNYLPPSQLVVGLGVMFQISEASKENHSKNRSAGDEGIVEADTTAPADKVSDTMENKESGEHEADGMKEVEDTDSDEDFPDVMPVTVDDSDEDFPDSKPIRVTAEDSEDEDFPDAKPLTIEYSDDEDADHSPVLNPLQVDARNRGFSAKDNLPSSTAPTTAPFNDTASVAESTTTATTPTTGKRHLSAKERRILRKGIVPTPTASQPVSRPSTPSIADLSIADSRPTVASSKQSANPTPASRGKRAKGKRAIDKYALQDEEERAAALARVGATAGKERARKAEEEKREKEEREARERIRRREQHLRGVAVGRAREEARSQPGADAGEEDAGVPMDLEVLERLVGRPRPGDEVLAAVPVCAPWAALARCKYKVKMQPGTTKKGRAVGEILGRWVADGKVPRNVDQKAADVEKMWPREVELLGGLKTPEVVGLVSVGKVKVMMPAGGQGGKGGKGDGKVKGKAVKGKGGKKGK